MNILMSHLTRSLTSDLRSKGFHPSSSILNCEYGRSPAPTAGAAHAAATTQSISGGEFSAKDAGGYLHAVRVGDVVCIDAHIRQSSDAEDLRCRWYVFDGSELRDFADLHMSDWIMVLAAVGYISTEPFRRSD